MLEELTLLTGIILYAYQIDQANVPAVRVNNIMQFEQKKGDIVQKSPVIEQQVIKTPVVQRQRLNYNNFDKPFFI